MINTKRYKQKYHQENMHKCMTDAGQQNDLIDYTYIASLPSISSTSKELKITLKQIWLLKMQIQKLSSQERKSDTRHKIMMGGLIKKAGLDYLHKDNIQALYGMLLANKKQLEKEPELLNTWAKLGQTLQNSKNI